MNTFTESEGGLGGINWTWVGIGVVVAALVVGIVFLVLGRINTRPVREGYLSMPVKGSTGVPCGQMSSEAEAVYQTFAARPLSAGEEGSLDLQNLKDLLGKMCCMKRDLMSPLQSVSSSRELAFATHMDIQPVADLTARCFSKTIPERDLNIQFEKWRTFGNDMIRRLCTAANLSEAEVKQVESLFISAWQDAYSVAQTTCLGGVPTGAMAVDAHGPAPHTPESLGELREYDGPGARY